VELSRLRRGTTAAVLAVALSAGVAVTSAVAGTKLKPRGCLEDAGGPEDCAAASPALGGASSIALSPDGEQAYVTAFEDDALVRLERDPRNGSLAAGQCIEDVGGPDTCVDSANGLNGALDLVISEDGRHLYTVGYNDSTLLHFRRTPRNGELRLKTCVDDADLPLASDVCGDGAGGAEGLGGPQGLALSPDGRWLYVAAQLDSAAVQFRLNRRGKPVWRDCVEDDDKAFADDCARNRQGLDDAQGIGVAGRSVYVAASSDDTVTHLRLNRETGKLGYKGCVENRTPTGPDDCAQSAEGLHEAYSIGISPDGRYLYSGTINDGSMAQFKLGRAGRLKSRGCVEAPFSPARCGTVAQGIGRAADFAFDSRGRSLYVAGVNPIQPFKRKPGSGELTEIPCIDDDDRPPSATKCTREAPGLNGVSSLSITPDDDFLYSAAGADSAVTTFRR